MNSVIQHLRRAVAAPDAAALADGGLLGCFIDQFDQAAFETLMRRHGPMVLGVCRRILENHHDAEDAFQATFLVLVHKAHTIRPRALVGNWLHGVALQTALKARQRMTRRRAKEKQVLELPEPEASAADSWNELRPVLDQELARLPDKYRAAVVLCDLEGKSYKEAARQLGWPPGTLSVRLARARKMLASRLARKGWALPAASLGAFLSAQAAPASIAPAVLDSTLRAAISLAAGQGIASGIVSTQVVFLVKGVMKAMLLSKLKALSSWVLMFGVLALGAGMVRQHSTAAQSTAPQAENTRKSKAEPPPTSRGGSTQVADYNAVFDKALKVVAHYFTLEYANRFEGRIDTLPAMMTSVGDETQGPSVRRRASIQIRNDDANRLEVAVQVHRETMHKLEWRSAGRDAELEKTILRRITGESEPNDLPKTTPDEILLHGEWDGQFADNRCYTVVFGPGDSLELLAENGENQKGTYSVDWTKTPLHMDGQWNEPRRADRQGRTWRTIIEFSNIDELRLQIGGVSNDGSSPRPAAFDMNAIVLTRCKRYPAGSQAASDQAQKDLEIADYYRRAGQPGSAHFHYELVCRRYPGTSHAQIASRMLAELKKLRIRLADGSEAWPEPRTSSSQPQSPPPVAGQPPATQPASRDEVSRLRNQVKSLEQRLAALEARPSSAAGTRSVSPARVAYIIVEGSRRISPEVILKTLSLVPGQTFDQQALEAARKKLAPLNATIKTKENSTDATYLDLVVTVEEK
jgi:RNA polymerase sigma factor (sigma-70 family)